MEVFRRKWFGDTIGSFNLDSGEHNYHASSQRNHGYTLQEINSQRISNDFHIFSLSLNIPDVNFLYFDHHFDTSHEPQRYPGQIGKVWYALHPSPAQGRTYRAIIFVWGKQTNFEQPTQLILSFSSKKAFCKLARNRFQSTRSTRDHMNHRSYWRHFRCVVARMS